MERIVKVAEEYTGVKFKTLFEGVRFGYPEVRKGILKELDRLKESGFIHGIPGNVSVRVEDGLVITPTGRDLAGVHGDDMVLVTGINEKAKIVRVIGKTQPSSESMMHWLIYENFPKIGAIVHFHDDKLLGSGLFTETDKEHPYGTLELAHTALKALKESRFIVLKGHGALAIGKDMKTCDKLIEKSLKSTR